MKRTRKTPEKICVFGAKSPPLLHTHPRRQKILEKSGGPGRGEEPVCGKERRRDALKSHTAARPE